MTHSCNFFHKKIDVWLQRTFGFLKGNVFHEIFPHSFSFRLNLIFSRLLLINRAFVKVSLAVVVVWVWFLNQCPRGISLVFSLSSYIKDFPNVEWEVEIDIGFAEANRLDALEKEARSKSWHDARCWWSLWRLTMESYSQGWPL